MESVFLEIGFTRQGLSQYEKRKKLENNIEEEIKTLVTELRVSHPRMGSRSMYHTLKNKGETLNVGINKFEQIVSRLNLTIESRRSFKPKTSDGKGKKHYPNLLNGLIINNIRQVIVGDITYYYADGQWCYIFTLKDIYSQRFLAIYPATTLEAVNALACLELALKEVGGESLANCIHHTDNGSQYEANIYLSKLQSIGMKISRAENCLENGSAEQLNGIIKNMYLLPWGITTFKDLQKACINLMKLSNTQRGIEQLNGLSPLIYEETIKSLPLDQRIQKELYDFKQNKDN
jgi:transposase InsO family protein